MSNTGSWCRRIVIWLMAISSLAFGVPRMINAAEAPVPLTVQTADRVGQGAVTPLDLQGPGTVTFTPPAAGRALRITGRLGLPKATWAVGFLDGAKIVARLVLVADDPLEAQMKVDLSGFRGAYFVKPDLTFYLGAGNKRFAQSLAEQSAFAEREQVAAKYDRFVSVYEHVFTVHLERIDAGLGVWLDGRYLSTLSATNMNITGGQIVLAKGNEILSALDVPALQKDRYLALDLKPYARPGTLVFSSSTNSFNLAAVNVMNGVPLLGVAPQDNIDVGLSRWLEEKSDPPSFCDTDTTRSAFDGNPESIILRVPKANYVAAHVLCAVDPNPARVPALTLRLTRFGIHGGDSGGRSDRAFGDTTIYLPQTATNVLPAGVKQVGDIEARSLKLRPWSWEWSQTNLPVYLATIPLNIGAVADLLGEDAPTFGRGKDFWDIELTKEIRTAVQFFNLQNCRVKPLGLPSGVHVFAMTLERSPVDVQVSAKQKGNIFYAADKPAFNLRLVNHADQAIKVEVTCDIKDYYGKKTTQSLRVEAPGKDKNGGVAEGTLSLAQPALGYFEAVLSAKLADGREIWRQPTTFAILPPDTRQAGAESPFGCWWFFRSHGCCDRLDWMGPILMKMGMRHCCPGPFSEAELAPYKLTYSMVPSWPEDKRTEFLQKNPNARIAMIFHEKGVAGAPYLLPPPELMGKPKPEIPAEAKSVKYGWDARWKEAEETCQWYREKYPNMKLSFGNSPSEISIWFMRYGFPKKYIDYFGMEGVAAWMMTEAQPRRCALQEVFWLAEMRKIYGYEDIPVSSGFEYIGRCSNPGALTEREIGELHARDALHCLAYGYPSINIGLSDDCPDSYYNTIYGASGFVHRNPLLTPKPAYVMFATLTLMLDGAKYQRYLDTGLRSLYALEFARGDERIYPIWTIRGKRSLAVEVKDNNVTVTDSMGNTRKLAPKAGVVELEATTAPVYLVSKTPVGKIMPGKGVFEETPPAQAVVVNDLSDPSAWEVEKERDVYLETYAEDLPYRQGQFEVRAVNDEEKGKVTELELLPQADAPKLVARYVALKLKTPVKLEKEVQRLGMWVKGNACWGRVFWEFEDAKGERYFSAADETSGWDVSDWKCRSSINFDGWCFVSLTVPKRYPGGYHGPTDRDWSYKGGDQDGIVQHPITVTRMVVAMRDWQVYVKDLAPAQSRTIRLGGLLAGE